MNTAPPHHDEDEDNWFEPLPPHHGFGLGGWSLRLSAPVRVAGLAVLIGLTFWLGQQGGAFEPRTSSPAIVLDAKAPNLHTSLQGHMSFTPTLREGVAGLPKATERAEAVAPAAPAPEVIDYPSELKRARELLKEKAWRDAIEPLERAARAWPKEPRGAAWRMHHYDLGKAFYKTNQPGKTLDTLEPIYEASPDWEKPLLLLGLAARNHKAEKKAATYFTLYIEAGGRSAKACNYFVAQGSLRKAPKPVRAACR